jgi:uncharacterized protein YcbX
VGLDDPGLAAAIGVDLGVPVRPRRDPAGQQDLDAPAFAEERWQGGRLQVGEVTLHLLHPCARCVIPTRDPDGDGSRWPALLRHLHRARAGLFGINARVLHPGRVAVGDSVAVAPP